MTKHATESMRQSTQPIPIPGLQVPRVKITEAEDAGPCFNNSPLNSVGNAAYDSPQLPRPSNDFSRVMVNLKVHSDVKRTASCDDVAEVNSDEECCSSSYPMSCSLPIGALDLSSKRRRRVRFDETTISLTADLGESATRFRDQWRKKRGLHNKSMRFVESKNIIVHHDDSEEIPSPQLERSNKNKSIFDACNYSPYGRYT